MGQYWMPVNLDKREFINPHKLGSGMKLWEQLASKSVGQALVILTAAMPEQRGGGDLREDEIVGRWAGDRIAIVGDYAADTDLAMEHKASTIYSRCRDGEYTDDATVEVEVVDFDDMEADGYDSGACEARLDNAKAGMKVVW